MRFIVVLIIWISFSSFAFSQEPEQPIELSERIEQLEERVSQLAYKLSNTSNEISKLQEGIKRAGLSILFFAFFCAWWAKSTGRSALLWFFLGFFLNIITAIVLIVKTERGT